MPVHTGFSYGLWGNPTCNSYVLLRYFTCGTYSYLDSCVFENQFRFPDVRLRAVVGACVEKRDAAWR